MFYVISYARKGQGPLENTILLRFFRGMPFTLKISGLELRAAVAIFAHVNDIKPSIVKDRKLLNIELKRLTAKEYRETPGSGIAVVLDNIRSAHNTGSAFRSADAFKADKVVLCGLTPSPPSPMIHKTALGAEQSVPFECYDTTAEAVGRLRDEGYTIVSVEQTVSSVKMDRFVPEPGRKYALVFGNEVDGVGEDVVELSDLCLEIPQEGTKHSLNVSVCIGVVLWHFRLVR